jgi:iron-sulfur cluster assembly accessory protein
MIDFPITITPVALEQFKSAMTGEGELPDAIRIGVMGGGCSGFMYKLDFIKTEDIDSEEDIIRVIDGIKFVVDIFSSEYLKGTEVDFISTLLESGFKFNNTQAKRTCGCGSSFSN